MCILLTARENTENGYLFAVHGEHDETIQALSQKLIMKIKAGLSQKYLDKKQFYQDAHYYSMIGDEIVGRIEYDEKEEKGPLVIIDGKPFTWEQFGEIMKINEGFQFELKIKDIMD